jgi:uncharacterized protein
MGFFLYLLLVLSLIFTFLAFFVLYRLSPGLLKGRRAMAFLLVAVIVHLGWFLVPSSPGDGESSSLMVAARTVTIAWLFSGLLIVVIGTPLLLGRGFYLFGRGLLTMRKRLKPAKAAVDMGRRNLLLSSVPMAVLTASTASTVSAASTITAMKSFEIRREEIRMRGLPEALDGFRIGQITDVHVGTFIEPEHLARAVDTLNEEGVDLQVMTGDLIDDMSKVDPTFDALERCSSRHGMLAVLGNHEKFRGLRSVLAAYERVAPRGRVRLLIDNSTVINHKGAPIRVVGVDYPMPGIGRQNTQRLQRDLYMKASAEKSFAGIREGEWIICLSHHPDFFPFAAERGAGLTISGHTHGGQIALFGKSLFNIYDYMLGRYRRGESHLYVSGGTGHWLPFRFGVPTEVSVLTLRSE